MSSLISSAVAAALTEHSGDVAKATAALVNGHSRVSPRAHSSVWSV